MHHQLQNVFSSLQTHLTADLKAGQNALTHPVAKGDAAEHNWLKMLKEHLPQRYQVSKAFVIDSQAQESDQIDIVIYDWQYTPLLYNKDDQRLIPAESVYAVFEVRPTLNRENVLYASEKAASVRRLYRTSAEIPYAAGRYEPRPLFPIISGILTIESDWKPAFGQTLEKALREPSLEGRLDLGCVVTEGAFDATYSAENVELSIHHSGLALVGFLFRLLSRLQNVGTVPAIDYRVYSDALSS